LSASSIKKGGCHAASTLFYVSLARKMTVLRAQAASKVQATVAALSSEPR
jgi:hypothetical protein